jgi:S-(hydroxymethyl)glutathione dehydrogenase/alcohol dehydrogenase
VRAAVLSAQPGPLEIEELQVYDPGPGEVLLRVAAAGLCHSDLHFMEGLFRTPLPSVLGHESAGVIEAVGPDVTYVQPGDHVICCVSIFCGRCKQCLTGFPYRCQNPAATSRPKGAPARLSRDDGTAVQQFSRLGGFAEQMLVHENAVVKIRDDMPLDRAALLGCGVLTGTGAAMRTAQVQPGDRVCVIGLGGIGLAAIQGARIAGATQIIAADLAPAKLELARSMGATDVVDASDGEVVAHVKDLSGGGVDHSFEAIGLKETVEQAFGMLDVGGTATVIGMVPSSRKVEIKGIELLAEKRLQGSMMGSNRFRVDLPQLVQLYLDGRLMLDELMSGTIALDDINAGYAALKQGEVTRNVITFGA